MKNSLLFLLALFANITFADTVKLALNWKPEPQFGGFYHAQLSGEFKKHGFPNVQILEGGSGTPTVQMLANKKVNYAIVSAEEILISSERNEKNPMVAVFATFQTNPQILMCHEKKNFKSLDDVFGSDVTLAMQSGLSYAQFLTKKFPKSKAKVVPYSGGVSTFAADQNFCQQGFLTSEPLAAKKAGAAARTFLVSDAGFNPYTTVVAVRRDELEKNPEQVKNFVAAVREGWLQYLKNPAPTNLVMHKKNPSMDLETFQASAQAQIKLISTQETQQTTLGSMSTKRWETLVQQMRDLGLIKSNPDLQNIFRNL